MSPASPDSSGRVTGKIARKMFFIFFSIAMIPIAVFLAAAYGYASGQFQQLSFLDQQRVTDTVTGYAVPGISMAAAGLAFSSAWIASPVTDFYRRKYHATLPLLAS